MGAEDSSKLPTIGRNVLGIRDLVSPAYVREAYRMETVKVGPPYNLADSQGCPAWTVSKMLDEVLEKEDWHRSYFRVTKQRKGRTTGPELSIRNVQSMVQLPPLRQGSKPKLASDSNKQKLKQQQQRTKQQQKQ